MDKNLTSDELYNRLVPLIKIEGTKEDTQEIIDLLHMLASVPTGQEMLTEQMHKGIIMPICVQSKMVAPNRSSNFRPIGRVNQKTKSIELCWANLAPTKSAIETKIEKAIVLGHEVRHYLTLAKINNLFCCASNIDELVLVVTMDEIYAYLTEEQLTRELCHQNHLTKKVMIDGKASALPVKIPASVWTDTFKMGLSGKIPIIKAYTNDLRRQYAKVPQPKSNFARSCHFRVKATDFLKEMQIAVSFDEAMWMIRSSLKSIPAAKSRLPEEDDR